MSTVLIENLDPIILEKLEILAQQHGRTLQEELKDILQQVAENKVYYRTNGDMAYARAAAARIRQQLAGGIHTDSAELKRESAPWVGIRQYTDKLSPQVANKGYIARSRQIYDQLCLEIDSYYTGWYVAIEPDSGDYFLNTNKALAQQQARQKHPQRLICTFQFI